MKRRDSANNAIGLLNSVSASVVTLLTTFFVPAVLAEQSSKSAPIPIIFDTDIGNDVDDVLTLSMLHALQTRNHCQLLAVTVTKPDPLAGPFVDLMNTFYGRPKIPIGCIRPSPANKPSKFLPLAEMKDGAKLRYP